MSASQIEQHTESLLSCPVCTEKFRETAKLLPCQHTFCLPCLRRCHNAGKVGGYRLSVLHCPICRKTCPVPAGGVDALPNDFRVKQFGELVEKIQQQSEHEDDGKLTKCSICQFRGVARRAEIFCATCDKNFCQRCADSHRNNPVFKQHVTRPLDDDHPAVEPSDSRCRDHNETLEYFCEQCERAVCTVCVLVAHQEHDVVGLSDAANVLRQILDRKLNSVRAQANKISSYRTRLADVEQLQIETRDACLAEIQRLASEACQLVDRRQKELTAEVNSAMDRHRHYVADVDRKLSLATNQLSTVCDQVTSSSAQLTLQRFAELKERIRLALKNPEVAVGDLMKADCLRTGPRVVADVKVNLGNLIEQQQTQNEFVRESQDAEEDGDNDTNADDQHTERDVTPNDYVINQVGSDNDDEVSRDTAYPCDDVDSMVTAASGELLWSTTSVDNCRGVCFLSSGDVVGASCTANSSASAGSKLQVFDIHGQFVRQLVGSVVARPWSLCYTASNDSLAVTDLDSTAIRILKSTLTIRDLSAWRGAGVIRPLAVAATESSSQYVLTDAASSSSSRVSIHTPVANRVVKLRAFNSDDLSPSLNYVAVDHTNRIVLSDSDNCAVYVYSVEGERLVQFKCETDDGRDRMSPQGIAIDASNNMLVAEQSLSDNGGRLTRFSPDGRLIDVVVEWSDDKPWAVAYDKSQRALAVATDTVLSLYRL